MTSTGTRGRAAAHLTVVALTLDAGYDDARRLQFATEFHDAMVATPGIDAAAAGWTVPFRYTGRGRCCWRTRLIGDPALDVPDNPTLSIVHPVTPGYFRTLGTAVAAGREFTRADATHGQPVSIVNAAAARDLFGTTEVVGRSVRIGDTETTVVGVVPGLHHWGLDQDIERAVYVPYAQHGAELADLHVVVRSSLDAGAVADVARAAIARLDPSLPIGRIATMEDQITRSVAGPRFLTALFGTFAGVALILACAGIYGSMLYTVNQRRREMGIRFALGADPGRVVRLVLRRGLALTSLGIGLGLFAAIAASRLMSDLVWGIEPDDPLTMAGVGTLLGISALLACLGPAWRAGRTDPLRALRAE